jgi:GTP-binding protein
LQIYSVVLHRAAYRPEDFPHDQRPQFAVVGRSNVGKSSFINTVLRRNNIARVSQTPGKTQAIHFYLINESFYIVDLPGYGYAKVAKSMRAEWGTLIQSYFETADDLKLLFVLLDSRRTPSDDDQRVLEWAAGDDLPTRIIMTKTDKLSNNELAASRREIASTTGADPASLIAFSKMTRRGNDDVWREILQHINPR